MSARRYGWRPDLPDKRDRLHMPTQRLAADLPLCTHNRAVMPACWDQGALGSCTGFAAGAAVTYERARRGEQYTPSFLQLYYGARALDGMTAVDAGAYIRDICKVVAQQGAAPESAWPYRPELFAKRPPKLAFRAALDARASSYARVPQDLHAIKRTLADGDTIVFGFSVYESFEADAGDDGIASLPQPGETLLGGHAVLAIDYDDALKGVICRNSWGSSWGRQGHFVLPYDYITDPDLAADFWVLKEIT